MYVVISMAITKKTTPKYNERNDKGIIMAHSKMFV